MAYDNVTFSTMGEKRKVTVRKKIETLWMGGTTATEVSKKCKISPRSAATALGNLTRQQDIITTKTRK